MGPEELEVPEEVTPSSTSSLHSLSDVLPGGVLKQKLRKVRGKRVSFVKARAFIRMACAEGSSTLLSPLPANRSADPAVLAMLKAGSPLLQALSCPQPQLLGDTLGNTFRVGLHSLQVTTELPLPSGQKAAAAVPVAAAAAAVGGHMLLGRAHSAPLPSRLSPMPAPPSRPAMTPLPPMPGRAAEVMWSPPAAAAGALGVVGVADSRPALAPSNSNCSLDVNACSWPSVFPPTGVSLSSLPPPQVTVIAEQPAADAAAALALSPELELGEDVAWEDNIDNILPTPLSPIPSPAAVPVTALPPSIRTVSTGLGLPHSAEPAYPPQQHQHQDPLGDKISEELASLDSMVCEAACNVSVPVESVDLPMPPLDESALQWGESVPGAPAPLGHEAAVGKDMGAMSGVSAATLMAGVPAEGQLLSCASAPVEAAGVAAAVPTRGLSPEWPVGVMAAADYVESHPPCTFTRHGPCGVVISSEGPICGRTAPQPALNMPAGVHPCIGSNGGVFVAEPWKSGMIEGNGSGSFGLPPKIPTKPVSRQLELNAEPRSRASLAAASVHSMGEVPTSNASRPHLQQTASEPIPKRPRLALASGSISSSYVGVPGKIPWPVPEGGLLQPRGSLPRLLSVCPSGPVECSLPLPGVSYGTGSAAAPYLPPPPINTVGYGAGASSGHGMCPQTPQYIHHQHDPQQQQGVMTWPATAGKRSSWPEAAGARQQSYWQQQPAAAGAAMAPLQSYPPQALYDVVPVGGEARRFEPRLPLPVISTSAPIARGLQQQQQQQGSHVVYQGHHLEERERGNLAGMDTGAYLP
jgi:hypothetical protein